MVVDSKGRGSLYRTTHFHQFEKIFKIVKLVHSDLTAFLDHSIVHNF